MKIIATIKRSAGNDSVGEMWQETAVFDETATVNEVMEWGQKRMYHPRNDWRKQCEGLNITLSIAQENPQ
jgi:hypothetical protein